MLGHSNLATTEIYLATTSKAKREAINRLEEDAPQEPKKPVIPCQPAVYHPEDFNYVLPDGTIIEAERSEE